jgi:hypothetical protein
VTGVQTCALPIWSADRICFANNEALGASRGLFL